MAPNPIRCAIYTRKSTEEGLEQDFNSLDAQREACAAYITSQRHEGWESLPHTYDDGGYSGGNTERPALKRLLKDVEDDKIQIIVVYKIDRLTRSLADFAKMVELLDKHKASFVSVTQQFNTTTSMGRLTLNVLLSFAQFEREVTSERIRDKVAASKAKGMWMGGVVPLGYDLTDRKLTINPAEAKIVQHIFKRYLALGSIPALRDELNEQGYRTKSRVSKKGNASGGQRFFVGHLAMMLENPLFIGKVRHNTKVYPGDHEAIISEDLWDQVQVLRKQRRFDNHHKIYAKERSLLVGLLFDAEGRTMTPSFSNKKGRYYRYYISQGEVQHHTSRPGTITRIPAGEMEAAISEAIHTLLIDDEQLVVLLPGLTPEQRELARGLGQSWKDLSAVQRHIYIRELLVGAELHSNRLVWSFKPFVLGKMINSSIDQDDPVQLTLPIRLRRIQGGARLIFAKDDTPNPVLVRAIARAHWWNHQLVMGYVPSLKDLAKQCGTHERVIRRGIHLAWLEPVKINKTLAGK
jgi:DNA invertase Pin-like site-specific DNA recombinase